MIALPKFHENDLVIASISGGKDSAALAIALQEASIPFVAVFADTGWEAPETYAHLEVMERVLGITIHRVGFPGGMRAKVLARAGFPARMQRWCTVELKVKPLDIFSLDLGEREQRAVLQAVGIRAEEGDRGAPVDHPPCGVRCCTGRSKTYSQRTIEQGCRSIRCTSAVTSASGAGRASTPARQRSDCGRSTIPTACVKLPTLNSL